MHQKAHAAAPSQATTVRLTRLPPIYPSPRVRARVSTPRGAPPNPSLAHNATGATPHCMGRDNDCPAPLPLLPQRNSHAHTNKPTPEREHASKQAGAKGRTQPHRPTTPSKPAPTPKSANTHTNTGSSANTKPQPPASKHTHNKPALPPPARTQEAPTQ